MIAITVTMTEPESDQGASNSSGNPRRSPPPLPLAPRKMRWCPRPEGGSCRLRRIGPALSGADLRHALSHDVQSRGRERPGAGSFHQGVHAIKSFKGGSSFYTWVYRIAVNKTINFLKQRKNRSAMSLNDLDFNAEKDPDLVALISDKTPRRDAALSELQKKLNEAMQKLSEQHRLVVTLHDVQGLAHEEIAEIMECNVGTVRSRLFYARQQLQGYLADYLK
jgi:RNA polymerase sigma factor (sigma-70 family)